MKINPYLENSRQAICNAITKERARRGSNGLMTDLAFALTELDAFRHGELQKSPTETLERIKLTCLTAKDGKDALGRIVRLCIDAGVEMKLDELAEKYSK